MFKNKFIFIRNLSLLCVIGYIIYWVFPFPPLIWRIILILLSLYVILVEEDTFLQYEKTILVFLFVNLIHFIVSYLWQTPSTGLIGTILCALLSLSLFTYLSQKGAMTDKFFTWAGIILLITAVLYYRHYERLLFIRVAAGDPDQNFTNNGSGVFLMLLPLLFLMKSNVQKWVSLLACLFFILLSAKRGNIVASVIPVVLFVFYVLKDSRRSFVKVFFVIVVILISSWLVYSWVETNDYLMYRIDKTLEGNSSGRDVIYAGAWHVWCDSDSFLHLLFGYGFEATKHQSLTGYHFAHNDWLEILVDYGLLGVLLYFIAFVSVFLLVKKVESFQMKMVLLSSVLIWLFKSFFSMGFTADTLPVLMISIGTALGRYKTQTKSI